MRQTIKEVETNLAYRWFLGLSLIEKVPHFSTFGKNYARRFRETNLFEQIFIIILEQAVDARFIHEAILYQKQLEEEINEVRIAEGKRPFCSIICQEVVERKISVAEKRLLCKKRTKKTVCLFYSYRLR